jgi:hypothetical protein
MAEDNDAQLVDYEEPTVENGTAEAEDAKAERK